MFESSLIALDHKKQSNKRWLSLPLAVGLHLVVFVSLGFAQYWNVEQVSAPPPSDIFVVSMVPPSPPAGPRRNDPASTHRASTPPVAHPAVTQPKDIPTEPLKPALPQVDSSSVVPTNPTLDHGPSENTSNVTDNSGNCTGPHCIGIGQGKDENLGPAIDDAPIPVGGSVLRPRIVERVEPQYTEMARRARLEGTVIVEAVIDETGHVVNVKVLKGLPMGLDKAAVDAVSRWRFEPATLHGRAVKVFYSLTVNFRVQ
jgi:protein TonB